MMQIRVTGLKEVQDYLKKLPIKLQKKVRDEGIPFLARNLQGYIKRSFKSVGYGRNSTGDSLRSIKYRKTENGAVIEILAPWLYLIETGKTRTHYVSPWTIMQHRKHPGSTFMEKAPKGQYKGYPILWRYKGPFIAPAIEKFKPTIPQKLNKFVNEAIR